MDECEIVHQPLKIYVNFPRKSLFTRVSFSSPVLSPTCFKGPDLTSKGSTRSHVPLLVPFSGLVSPRINPELGGMCVWVYMRVGMYVRGVLPRVYPEHRDVRD